MGRCVGFARDKLLVVVVDVFAAYLVFFHLASVIVSCSFFFFFLSMSVAKSVSDNYL